MLVWLCAGLLMRPPARYVRMARCVHAALLPVMTHLVRAGQQADIVAGAVHFVLLNGPALYAYTLAECLKRYLMAQASCQTAAIASPPCCIKLSERLHPAPLFIS